MGCCGRAPEAASDRLRRGGRPRPDGRSEPIGIARQSYTYSPELNPIENIWRLRLRQNRLANRVFDSYDTIVAACCDA